MTAILMSSNDHGDFGIPTPRRERKTGRPEDMGLGGAKSVPPAIAEQPKSWFGRIIEAITKPVEPNFHNP